MKKIDRITSKRGWTGEEVGRILIKSFLHDMGAEDREDRLFTQEDFDIMVRGLKNPADIQTYNVFVAIRNALLAAYSQAQGYFQQLCNGFYRSGMFLQGAMYADRTEGRIERLPLIMSESEYAAALEEAEDMLREKPACFGYLAFDTMAYCMKRLEEGDKKSIPASIRKELEKLEKTKLTDQRMIEAAVGNEYYGEGTLKSYDFRTKSEFTEAIEKATKRREAGQPEADVDIDAYIRRAKAVVHAQGLFFYGIEGLKKRYKEARGHAYKGDPNELLSTVEAVLNNFGMEVLEGDKYEDIVDALGLDPEGVCFAHRYTAEGKREAVQKMKEQELTLLEYIKDYSIEVYDCLDSAEGLRAFKADFPDLFKALEAYIKENVPAAAKLKPTQYYKDFITYGELEDLGYKPAAGVTTKPTAQDIYTLYEAEERGSYSDRRRIQLKGIAVWKDREKPADLDTKAILDNPFRIETLYEDKDIRAELTSLKALLIDPALSFLYRFDLLLRVLAKTYSLEGLEVIKPEMEPMKNQIQGYNGLLYSFYDRAYGDKEEKERKRALIKELFKPIDMDAVKPTKEQEEALQNSFLEAGYTAKAQSLLKNADSLIIELPEIEKAYKEALRQAEKAAKK